MKTIKSPGYQTKRNVLKIKCLQRKQTKNKWDETRLNVS